MKRVLAVCVVLAMAGGSRADIILFGGVNFDVMSIPSPSDPAFETWTISLVNTHAGLKLVGWDATLTAPFMNQQNPFGFLPTIFMDNNAAFAGDPNSHLDLDSQYLFLTSDADPTNGVNVSSSSESATELSADFIMIGGYYNPNASSTTLDLAQLCLPVGSGLSGVYPWGWVLLNDADLNLYKVWFPEPASLALLGLGGLVTARRRRR